MPVQKGTNNFLSYQKDNVEYIQNRIDVYLDNLRKSKGGNFDNVSQLADFLCERLTEDVLARWKKNGKKTSKPKPFSKSTLYRNSKYRAKLDSYIAGLDPAKGVSNTAARTNLTAAQAKISEQELTISNLSNRVKVLEKYIENNGIEASNNNKPELVDNNLNSVNDLAKTAHALSLLLDATESQFLVKNSQIINAGKLVNNVVVNKNTLAPYIKWSKQKDSRE